MISKELLSQIKFEEGLRLKKYKCTAGHWTIGYGRNLDVRPYFNGEKIPDKISKELAEKILIWDIEKTEEALDAAWHGFNTLSGARKDAVINMAFQLGVNGFMAFKNMREAIVNKNWEQAYKQGLDSKWAKQCPARSFRVMRQLMTGEYYQFTETVQKRINK